MLSTLANYREFENLVFLQETLKDYSENQETKDLMFLK